MFKKLLLLLGILYLIYTQIYSYNIDKAVQHVEQNALSTSHTCCAWFVMRAMQAGGCPIGIYPAWAYKYVLPFYGFKTVIKPQKGDIVVFNKTNRHFWGHIAMYTGTTWISDYKQKKMNPYKDEVAFTIFRYK